MKVIRKVEKNVKHFQVGDQIAIGRYTATAVEKDNDGMIFCLDQVYGEKLLECEKIEGKLKGLFTSKAFGEIKDLLMPISQDKDGNDIYFRLPFITELYSEYKCNPWEYAKNSAYYYGHDISGRSWPYWILDNFFDNLVSVFISSCCGLYPATEKDEKSESQSVAHIRPVFKLREG